MAIDWNMRAQVLSDPDNSDTVKRAMMRFWLVSDRHETAELDEAGRELLAAKNED